MAQIIERIVRSKYPPRDTRVLWLDTKNDLLKAFTSNGWTKVFANTAINTLRNAGYLFAGIATIDTNPETPDAKVFYIANGKGTYTNFGGIEVTEDEVVFLIWDSSWHKVSTGIASNEKLSELGEEVQSIEGKTNALEPKNTEEEGFYICDHEGNVLIRLDILDTKGGIGDNLANSIKTLVQNVGAEGFTKIESNELGEKLKAAVKLEAGHQSTIENGFYVCNENGEVCMSYINGLWNIPLPKEEKIIKHGSFSKHGSLAAGETWVLTNNSVKNNEIIQMSAVIPNGFTKITFGHGDITGHETSWIDVTPTKIILHVVNSGNSELSGYPKEFPYSMTFKNNIQVSLEQKGDTKATVKVYSNGEMSNPIEISIWWGSSGNIFLTSETTLDQCYFIWSSPQLQNGIWLFGDSYFSLGDPNRWTTYLFKNGHNNFMLDAHPGMNSATGLNHLKSLISVATPKMIVWCLGMNDPDCRTDQETINPNWKSAIDEVIEICKKENVLLVLSTIPTVEGGWNPDTQSHNIGKHLYKNQYVKETGLRYIDFAAAVGANESTGEWFNNGQSDDMLENYGIEGKGRIHPTKYGAKALYIQAIIDCPEIIQ